MEPWIDLEAVMEFVIRVGCPEVSAPDAVSFLASLAGDRVVEYFGMQMMDKLEAIVSNTCVCRQWSTAMASHVCSSGATNAGGGEMLGSGPQPESLKRKLQVDSEAEDASRPWQKHRPPFLDSILGKRSRESIHLELLENILGRTHIFA